jgi:hypothetical protein
MMQLKLFTLIELQHWIANEQKHMLQALETDWVSVVMILVSAPRLRQVTPCNSNSGSNNNSKIKSTTLQLSDLCRIKHAAPLIAICRTLVIILL